MLCVVIVGLLGDMWPDLSIYSIRKDSKVKQHNCKCLYIYMYISKLSQLDWEETLVYTVIGIYTSTGLCMGLTYTGVYFLHAHG